MYKGEQRFNFFLDQLQSLLANAQNQKNPALWLYSNNARTTLFMLEALAKLVMAQPPDVVERVKVLMEQ